MSTNFVVPISLHNDLVAAAYRARGFTAAESQSAARFSEITAWHGIKTHNAIKALHLDEHLGSKAGGCKPGATVEKLPSRFKAVARWNANRKLGQAVAFEAMAEAMKLADEFGIGAVAVDNAFHYLWGGGYVIDAAKKGYIAYTCCTAALAEVVPHGGKFPTLGTNPHSWAFPTTELIGFPICIDWATSTVAMGRVQQFVREGKQLPPGSAVDKDGRETTDPNKVAALLPFGQHKGYGLSLIDELMAAYIGGSIPTIRNRWPSVRDGEKGTCCFHFQCICPEAISGENFARDRSQQENVKAVIDDIMGHGNSSEKGGALLPGQIEANGAALSAKHGGLIFTEAEIAEFERIASECGFGFDRRILNTIDA
ncbi:Ldh family oxidoreductase [soil metagenome]